MKKTKKTTKKVENKRLNPKEEKFCRNYAQNSSLFSNATLSYADAYGVDLDSKSREEVYKDIWDEGKGRTTRQVLEESEYKKAYDVCSQSASRLLRKDKIDKRIIQLLNEMATDEFVDAIMIRNMKQTANLNASNTAISEYNKVKARITNKIKFETVPVPPEEKEVADQVITQFLNGRNTKNPTK